MAGGPQRYVLMQQLMLICLVCSIAFYLFSRLSASFNSATQTGTQAPAVDHTPKRILITGGAGFIGFHLAKTLAANPENLVIAMDNFNDYYDVKLKIDRAYELHQLGVAVHHEDVCNADFLREVFMEHQLTHVAHLAAQAGVRYSLQNPLAYVRANVECQVALLDVMRDFPHVKLVYASSSSVYGKESSIPFSLAAHTDRPGNMYAATKKTDELLGYHYCHAFNITSVGLRFFTVYGPWGRPDMAVYKFAESILDGKEVPMYHVSSEPSGLGRDFTYIDDVIGGILASLDYKPSSCGERFNLGYGNPVSVPALVDMLQEELGVPANVKKLPLPPTEILRTWADLSTSTELLGFKPETDLRLGVKKFVVWYKGYRKWRSDQEEMALPSQGDNWYKSLLEEKEKRAERYAADAITRHNEELLARLEHHRNKYYEWARNEGLELPLLHKGPYQFFHGVDSSGGDIVRVPALRNNIEALKDKCREVTQCIAFNSEGVLKSKVGDKSKWAKVDFFSAQHQGLYVAEVDLCKADMHDCAKYATCTPILPAQYSCKCHTGYYGNGRMCLPRYGEANPKELQWEYAADLLGFYNVSDMKKDKNMVFFQGLDSPGGDYMVADQYSGNGATLQHLCRIDPICIAVNTNGLMKRRVADKRKWTRWSNNLTQGIYVFDLDYCELSDEACPDHAHCQRIGPAHFTCVCHPPYSLVSGECVALPPTLTKATPSDTSKKIQKSQVKVTEAAVKKLVDNSENKAKAKDQVIAEKEENVQSNDKLTQPESNPGAAQGKFDGSLKSILGSELRTLGTDDITKAWRQEGQNQSAKTTSEEKEAVHIIISVDGNHYKSLPTLVNSIVSYSSLYVYIHIVTCNMEARELYSYLHCFSYNNTFSLHIQPFDAAMFDDVYRAYMKKQDKGLFGYLSSCGNYARFFFHRLFPEVDRAVYLDSDTIVQDDIAKLWDTNKDTIISAVKRETVTYGNFFRSDTASLFKERYNNELRLDAPTFNAGVYMVSLSLWRQEEDKLDTELHFWMAKNVEKSLWSIGTQAPMLLIFYQAWGELATRWNTEGLGWRKDMRAEELAHGALLHWNGPSKPWQDLHNPYVKLWQRNSPEECQGKGKCLLIERSKVKDKWREWACSHLEHLSPEDNSDRKSTLGLNVTEEASSETLKESDNSLLHKQMHDEVKANT